MSIETIAARNWARRARQEGDDAREFAHIAASLRADGAPEPLVAAAFDSGHEEVRHAALCVDLVAQLGGTCASDAERQHANATAEPPLDRAQLLHRVVAVCCISESLSAVLLTAMLERCEHDGVRYVLREVLRDEVTHARIGWGYLASLRHQLQADGADETLARALPNMLAGTVPASVRDPEPEPRVAEELEALGCLARPTIADLFRQSLEQVIFPGLEESAIDTSRARDWLRRWSSHGGP